MGFAPRVTPRFVSVTQRESYDPRRLPRVVPRDCRGLCNREGRRRQPGKGCCRRTNHFHTVSHRPTRWRAWWALGGGGWAQQVPAPAQPLLRPPRCGKWSYRRRRSTGSCWGRGGCAGNGGLIVVQEGCCPKGGGWRKARVQGGGQGGPPRSAGYEEGGDVSRDADILEWWLMGFKNVVP